MQSNKNGGFLLEIQHYATGKNKDDIRGLSNNFKIKIPRKCFYQKIYKIEFPGIH